MSSTTRHLINRQRRLAAVSAAAGERTAGVRPRAAAQAALPAPSAPSDPATSTGERPSTDRKPSTAPTPSTGGDVSADRTPSTDLYASTDPAPDTRTRTPRRLPVAVALLAVLTVLLGGFAALAASRASGLHQSVAARNTALTDTARTSEVKGTIAAAVNAVFSYDYADTARTDAAAKRVLTGKAVQQYATMLAQVRAQAPARKLVLTTTVTDTGVETLDGDRARVLVFADQRNTSTAKAGADSTYAPAMFAVDAVRQGGGWKIAAIDTFG